MIRLQRLQFTAGCQTGERSGNRLFCVTAATQYLLTACEAFCWSAEAMFA
jgi:hypothetical protein